ncbi:AMP-dependent synthetase and ligase [Ruminiclostridium papyrosolvens DSM 2782]|uniref:AMP-dependent synthetase and ligase n=1 Tax=Ruminiclostridium papyrosolvens DSM 2782 TaxID=588581 RepID=F1TC90_9FIRM|nr:phenylacetate--CoA ligase family protein [Ruminiclostridium papyrosolvens]EGD48005.1 AMP-dependent synthetase and ligase [Ruminiclostridium papyrosolvens DSM 2782]WES36575.1 phenylacetate--CoA ligase family protein [Ruminiclostridium papyrosolvens DSM 2782]
MKSEQREKLTELLWYLNENNDFYRELMGKLHIALNGDVENSLRKFPILHKKDIRDNYNTYFSKTSEIKIEEFTSGSSGVPLKCQKTRYERLMATANIWKQRYMHDPKVTLDNYFSFHDLKTYKQIGNLFLYDPPNMKKCFEKMCSLEPRWISGPISAIEKYARLVEEGYLSYENKTIRVFENMGEFAEPEQREYVEKILGCKTINHYGCIESWCIAYECPHGSMHVQDSMMYVEQLPSNAWTEENAGEIVITSLYNKLMPLIRYNTHDLGTVDYCTCKCGKTSQVIKLLGGRTTDMIQNSKNIPGELFFKRGVYKLIRKGFDCIEGFKVMQTTPKDFIFYIAMQGDYKENVTNFFTEYIQNGLGADIRIQFQFVDSLPPLPSGKTKIFHSLINI